MPEFAVKIVERPAVKTAGLKISTTMDKASVDCPKLWSETFVPYMETFPCDGTGNSYGVCKMTSETALDYWAVMPLGKGASTPEGLSECAIPGGLYAECPVKSLQEMGQAYEYLYTAWSQTQKDYAVNFMAPCFELYNNEIFLKTGALTLYIPVTKK